MVYCSWVRNSYWQRIPQEHDPGARGGFCAAKLKNAATNVAMSGPWAVNNNISGTNILLIDEDALKNLRIKIRMLLLSALRMQTDI